MHNGGAGGDGAVRSASGVCGVGGAFLSQPRLVSLFNTEIRGRLRSALALHSTKQLAFLYVLSLAMPLLATPDVARCDLQKDAAGSFRGYCQWPDRKVDAKLTRHDSFWTGEMTPRNPEDPDLFEVTDRTQRQAQVAKTPYGWFPITSLAAATDRLTLSFSITSEVPPSSDDSRILQLALQMLQDESRWNRHDDRTCVEGAERRSLYCALEEATARVVGRFHYRQPALQIVRGVVGEVGQGRIREHRLMDFNNHPETTLHDIQNVLQIATERVRNLRRIAEQSEAR